MLKDEHIKKLEQMGLGKSEIDLIKSQPHTPMEAVARAMLLAVLDGRKAKAAPASKGEKVLTEPRKRTWKRKK